MYLIMSYDKNGEIYTDEQPSPEKVSQLVFALDNHTRCIVQLTADLSTLSVVGGAEDRVTVDYVKYSPETHHTIYGAVLEDSDYIPSEAEQDFLINVGRQSDTIPRILAVPKSLAIQVIIHFLKEQAVPENLPWRVLWN